MATVEIKAALAKHVPEMVEELVRLATEAERGNAHRRHQGDF
jgi:hypothetical protein